MEEQIRRRSSSAGRPSNQHLNHVPSANHFQDHNSHLDIDPAINSSAFTSGSFNPDGSSPNVNAHSQYNFPIPASIPGPPFKNQGLSNNNFDQRDLEQSYPQHDNTTNLQNPSSNLTLQQSSPQFPSELIGSNAPNGFEDLSQHDLAGKIGQDFSNPFLIETDLQGSIQPPHQSINPADIMSNMSSPQNLIPTPPNLMLPESHSPRQGSPAPSPGQMYSPNHSRHTSLDPSSAIFNQGQQQNDWTGMQFQIHRRAPSEHSDVSSSVAPSPYLQQHDGFDLDQNPSPMIGPQPDNPLYQDALGIGDFTLSDPQQQQQQQQQQRMSPRHSPFVSPRMHPQAGLGLMQENNFMLTDMNNNFNGGPGPEMFTTQNDAFPLFHQRHGSNDMGRATQMVPPEINVEFAPNTRQSTVEPSRQDNDYDALSPPDRGRRGRHRAKSDGYISRPVSPCSPSSSLGAVENQLRQRSLSPFDTSLSPNVSRDPSPAAKASRRSSTSSIPNRDYILELADPSRPAASGIDKRVQKHPATFQCTLCPKRFTRAYNLRSHLRTHTDERPFVCTVCGKAFARQHDRKRHEGLHSGEKKFVCKGELSTGGSWGCGRRFARADALGRHFRSEAGRICIKPLLDEEAMERQRVYDEQVQLDQSMTHVSTNGGPMMPQQPGLNGANNGFEFPAAILAQYPALQAFQWDPLGQAGPSGDDGGELSGRSSFDASSQGEYFDDDEGGYVSGNGGGVEFNGMGGWGPEQADWPSDYEGR